ncbi:MAG: nucleoside kinase [Candidatus Marinimicrobia bacterium]|nr:nucleoside kinase [Candidatus Neomarinimicrobiota bacterium]MBL7023155.1 nucleoside kinase [Candidatus Neomarinimicrobiota bacterium]MBL7109037.1 nucleoside kinase [Candidatus Neomarinimicrobiota bacterium]
MKNIRNISKLSENQATLAFLLSSAYRELFSPSFLIIEHSFADGLFCHSNSWDPISEQDVSALSLKIREYLNNSQAIELTSLPLAEILSFFTKTGFQNKSKNLKKWQVDPVPVIKFGDKLDYRIQPMATDKNALQEFEIRKYNNGLLLRFPTIANPINIPKFKDCPNLFSIIEEFEQWGNILGIESIPNLNDHINKNGIKELVWISEGLHEKKISHIADRLAIGFPKKRVVIIAGPSSSGKTTFAKRLNIQLKVNGFKTHQISMDDYFLSREEIPVDENGFQDFEAFSVLDKKLLSERINLLLGGDRIPVRKFNYDVGGGSDTDKFIEIGENDFVILEGIHGLNPKLTSLIADGQVQRIYVSAITQLIIDSDHRVSTSDNRLLRRMVRDIQFRGYSPEETLERWNSVRIGEEQNIFPFQEKADFLFNSALAYELPVLSSYALPLLKSVSSDFSLFKDVERLKTLLEFFEPLNGEIVPGISILREFIGSSEFNY